MAVHQQNHIPVHTLQSVSYLQEIPRQSHFGYSSMSRTIVLGFSKHFSNVMIRK